MERECAIDECDRPHLARGLCHRHYYRAVRYGSPHAQTEKELRRDGYPTLDKARLLVVSLKAEGRSCAAIVAETGFSASWCREIIFRARRGELGEQAQLALLLADQRRDMAHGDHVYSVSLDKHVADTTLTGYGVVATDSLGRRVR